MLQVKERFVIGRENNILYINRYLKRFLFDGKKIIDLENLQLEEDEEIFVNSRFHELYKHKKNDFALRHCKLLIEDTNEAIASETLHGLIKAIKEDKRYKDIVQFKCDLGVLTTEDKDLKNSFKLAIKDNVLSLTLFVGDSNE